MNMKRIAFAVLAVSGIAATLIMHAKPAAAYYDGGEYDDYECVRDSSGTVHCAWR